MRACACWCTSVCVQLGAGPVGTARRPSEVVLLWKAQLQPHTGCTAAAPHRLLHGQLGLQVGLCRRPAAAAVSSAGRGSLLEQQPAQACERSATSDTTGTLRSEQPAVKATHQLGLVLRAGSCCDESAVAYMHPFAASVCSQPALSLSHSVHIGARGAAGRGPHVCRRACAHSRFSLRTVLLLRSCPCAAPLAEGVDLHPPDSHMRP